VLTGAFAAAVVEGLQSEDVVATPKHFVANNQETRRTRVSAEVDERALRECYLPGFRAAADAGAGAMMTSYNCVNGTHVSDHRRLLTEILKDEWGSEGFVMSDWFGNGEHRRRRHRRSRPGDARYHGRGDDGGLRHAGPG